jgi:hypothetical protein
MDALRKVVELRAGAVELILDLGEPCRGTFSGALACLPELRGDAGESLLCTLAQLAFQTAPFRVGDLDDPAA